MLLRVSQPNRRWLWAQVAGPTALPASLLASPLASLRVPAGTLQAGGTYVLRLTGALASDESQQSSADVAIFVRKQPLAARVLGPPEVRASAQRALVLDASASRDPDGPEPAEPNGPQAGLSFAWACSLADGKLAGPCLDPGGAPLALSGGAVLTLPAGALPPSNDAPYVFSVTVSAPGKAPAAAAVAVSLAAERVPGVQLQALAGRFMPDGGVAINPGDLFVLFAACDAPGGALAWAAEAAGTPVALGAPAFYSEDALGGLSSKLFYAGADGAGGADDKPALAPGNTYHFTAACSVPDVLAKGGALIGSARARVLVNAPPQGPPCRVCRAGAPKSACEAAGVSIFDSFRVACDGWCASCPSPEAGQTVAPTALGPRWGWGNVNVTRGAAGLTPTAASNFSSGTRLTARVSALHTQLRPADQ